MIRQHPQAIRPPERPLSALGLKLKAALEAKAKRQHEPKGP